MVLQLMQLCPVWVLDIIIIINTICINSFIHMILTPYRNLTLNVHVWGCKLIVYVNKKCVMEECLLFTLDILTLT